MGGIQLATAKKVAAKKQAKNGAKVKAIKSVSKSTKKLYGTAVKQVLEALSSRTDVNQEGLRAAFHHMQRAAVVISLMEKGTGEDLRDLLDRGAKLYSKAAEHGDEAALLRAIGLLRAAEHLAMAGLYAARHKHRQKVAEPAVEWLSETIAGVAERLKAIEKSKRGKGTDLFPATEEMLHQAAEVEDDLHMAYELAMAAEGLCFALENGL
jgi:hypothetical protein